MWREDRNLNIEKYLLSWIKIDKGHPSKRPHIHTEIFRVTKRINTRGEVKDAAPAWITISSAFVNWQSVWDRVIFKRLVVDHPFEFPALYSIRVLITLSTRACSRSCGKFRNTSIFLRWALIGPSLILEDCHKSAVRDYFFVFSVRNLRTSHVTGFS
jgi:hypothetical protein